MPLLTKLFPSKRASADWKENSPPLAVEPTLKPWDCALVWARSCHVHKVDLKLNKSRRIITGVLKSTPLPALYRLTDIPPPHIRRGSITWAAQTAEWSQAVTIDIEKWQKNWSPQMLHGRRGIGLNQSRLPQTGMRAGVWRQAVQWSLSNLRRDPASRFKPNQERRGNVKQNKGKSRKKQRQPSWMWTTPVLTVPVEKSKHEPHFPGKPNGSSLLRTRS